MGTEAAPPAGGPAAVPGESVGGVLPQLAPESLVGPRILSMAGVTVCGDTC